MKRIGLIVALLLWPLAAMAQSPTKLCIPTGVGNSCQVVDSGNPLPVNASVSISGFHQESVLTPLSVTTANTTSGAFTAAKTVIVANAGTTNTAYCALGNTATTSGQPVPPLSWVAFTSTVETTVSCITASSTTTVNVSVGGGLPTGAGGGGGGGAAITNYALESGGVLGQMLTAIQAGAGNNGAAGPPASIQVGSVDGSGNLQAASATNPIPVINAGCVSYHLANGTANTTNATNMKAVPATLCNLVLESVPGTGIVGYLKIYDTAGTPTCSSATGLKHVFAIPASASAIGGVRPISPPGETYATGIGFCVVGGPTDTDNTAAPAGILVEASTK